MCNYFCIHYNSSFSLWMHLSFDKKQTHTSHLQLSNKSCETHIEKLLKSTFTPRLISSPWKDKSVNDLYIWYVNMIFFPTNIRTTICLNALSKTWRRKLFSLMNMQNLFTPIRMETALIFTYNHLHFQFLLLIACTFHYILISTVTTAHKILILFPQKPGQKSTAFHLYASLQANTESTWSWQAV